VKTTHYPFMLFAHSRGVMRSLTTDYVDPTTTIPYFKGTWSGIHKIEDQPDLAKTVTFRPLDRSRPA
jgi:arsenite oxidase large subunit